MSRIGLIILSIACSVVMAEPLSGVPPHSRFSPPQELYPENFELAQDASGVLYVGNINAVQVYDGARCTTISLPNNDLVRSLVHDGKDRIYAGGFDLFGYIQRDVAGSETYHDLTSLVPEPLRSEGFAVERS